jgi:hypothetical protein
VHLRSLNTAAAAPADAAAAQVQHAEFCTTVNALPPQLESSKAIALEELGYKLQSKSTAAAAAQQQQEQHRHTSSAYTLCGQHALGDDWLRMMLLLQDRQSFCRHCRQLGTQVTAGTPSVRH